MTSRIIQIWFLIVVISFLNLSVLSQNQEQFLDSNGVKIRYKIFGTGEPVILVHGWASNGEQNWAEVIKDLSKDFQVIVLDCRGHGKSDKPHEIKQYGVEMVNDIIRLMDNLKIKKTHVAGYSMGAMIVLKLLATHPKRINSAIIAGQGGVREDTIKQTEEPVLVYLDEGMSVADAMIKSSEPKPNKQEEFLIKFAFANNDSKALAASMRGFKNLLITNKELKKIKTPILAIYSVEGETVKPLKNLIKSVELKEIKDANHSTAPFKTEFVESIRLFVEKKRISK